jgi:hypothetical protein
MKRSVIGPIGQQLVAEIGKSGLFNYKELLKIATFEAKLDSESKVESKSELLLMAKYGIIKGEKFFESKDGDQNKANLWMEESTKAKESKWVDIIPAKTKTGKPKEVPVALKLNIKKDDIEKLKDHVSKSQPIHIFGTKLILLLEELIKDFTVIK